MYYRLNELVPKLTRQTEESGAGDFWVDEKAHTVLLSEVGHEHIEAILGQAGLTVLRPATRWWVPVATWAMATAVVSCTRSVYSAASSRGKNGSCGPSKLKMPA